MVAMFLVACAMIVGGLIFGMASILSAVAVYPKYSKIADNVFLVSVFSVAIGCFLVIATGVAWMAVP